MRGIFYNSKKSVCSIHESGIMCYNILKNSLKFTLDYTEEPVLEINYDFAIINQHHVVNNWMTEHVKKIFGKPVFCIVTEVTVVDRNEDNPINTIPNYFDHYIVLDPTIKETDKIHGFGRPIEDYDIKNILSIENNEIPIIGSFGLATPGKNWNEIIRCVNNDFDNAIIRFNIPCADYINKDIQNNIIFDILQNADKLITKPGIKFYLTQNNYTKDELIKWCASNTINCFFYNRVHINKTGLAAVTDQAISAGKPILVSSDPTFRHIHKYINHYPNLSIKQAITETKDGVLRMKDDWSSYNFLLKFEKILFA